jgi:hypothetical protein
VWGERRGWAGSKARGQAPPAAEAAATTTGSLANSARLFVFGAAFVSLRKKWLAPASSLTVGLVTFIIVPAPMKSAKADCVPL